MLRRSLLGAGASLPLISLAGSALAADQPVPPPTGPAPFDGSTVHNLARQLATKSYQKPVDDLPSALKTIDYPAYQGIRFDQSQSLWRGQGLNFTAAFFHRGYIYGDRVDIYEVANGQATPIAYSASQFTFDKVQPPTGNLGFAGFKIRYPLNHSDVDDEVCAFLGASYFRAIAKGQGYGLSARGLAINTANQNGEEFPVFRKFWLERPTKGADVLVIHALLDSPSTSAAFRFSVRPGEDTVFDVEAAIYPRVDMPESGLAPLTSMFMHDLNDHTAVDDWRVAVHDSGGLQMRSGHDEALWRPLTNPRNLQVSAFTDSSPRGFGLMQRERVFSDYQDLEARYEKRPSLWVEPIGDWGQGIVELVEIPSNEEVNDNMVAFWRPKDPLKAKGEYLLNYRLHWCWAPPGAVRIGQVMQTLCGVAFNRKHRQFVIDFVGEAVKNLPADPAPAVDTACSVGKIVSVVAMPNPDISGWRVSIELDPEDNKLVELHARLMQGDKPLTETWLYRWTLA
jgi:periplasmic glucans biosynthesis protein